MISLLSKRDVSEAPPGTKSTFRETAAGWPLLPHAASRHTFAYLPDLARTEIRGHIARPSEKLHMRASRSCAARELLPLALKAEG
jgi:hypothetical protein